ncbi:hypothetical protein HanRHA438_Chr10g0439961 [Helianthus annuus]|nr:hypothetical protein HanRHA438_Chr10g0439961 [Helianthus annuus]
MGVFSHYSSLDVFLSSWGRFWVVLPCSKHLVLVFDSYELEFGCYDDQPNNVRLNLW